MQQPTADPQATARNPDATPPSLLREAGLTLHLAGPLILAQLAVMSVALIDTVMMGWLGPRQLAAGALANNLMFPLYLFAMGVVIAVAPIVAQELGARQYRGVRRTVRQGFWVAILFGVLFSLVLWHGGAILRAFGQEAENTALAQVYLRWAVWGFLPSLGFVVLRSFLTAHARPRAILVAALSAVALKAFGNYALMFGHFGFPALGLVGAGIMTSVTHTAMFLGLLVFVLRQRHFRRYAIAVRFWKADWPRFREILSIGFPIGLAILAESAFFSFASIMMGWIGTVALAAHAIAVQCAATAFMVPLGVSQAATVRVGFVAGAGDSGAVGRAGWVAIALGGAVTLIPAALFLIFPYEIVDLFLDLGQPENQPVLGLAVGFLAVAALFQLMDGTQVIAAGCLRGLKDTQVPSAIAVFSYWVIGLGSSYLMAFRLGWEGRGVWLGLAVALTVVAVLMILRFHLRDRFVRIGAPRPAEAL